MENLEAAETFFDNKSPIKLAKFTKGVWLLLVLLLAIILTVTAGLLGAFKGKAASNSITKTNSENGSVGGIIYKTIAKNYEVVHKHIKVGMPKLNIQGQKKKNDNKSKANIEGLKMKQDIECKQGADKRFEIFVENLVIDLKYDPLFDDIKSLRCAFCEHGSIKEKEKQLGKKFLQLESRKKRA